MLIEFSVSNFRSFKEKATLSMVASPITEHHDSHVYHTDGQPGLVKTAVLYGANASGKSNFIKAFSAMREIVRESSKSQRGDKIATTAHFFDKASRGEPTEFEVSFIVSGVRYQYGFTATSDRFYEEWLFAYPKGRAQRWFTRTYDEKNEKHKISFSEKLIGQKQLWTDATRENSLFLSTAVQLNSTQLGPIFDWFDETARVLDVGDIFTQYTASLCKSESSRKGVVALMQGADLDIADIVIKENKIDFSQIPKEFPDEVKKELEGKTYFDVRTVHNVIDGDPVELDLDDESDGTRKFFGLAGPWIDILATGKVVWIDELHENLHPQMLQLLVGVFNDVKTNPRGAQLIFSTHDTTILDQKFLRRDQIWFVAKKSDKSSEIYSLLTFSPRKDHEDLAKGYLIGRYGALPYFQGIAKAFGAEVGI